MGQGRPFSEEKINARLREVTAELRKLRQELQDDIRSHRRGSRPFIRIHEGDVGTVGSGRTRER